MTPFTHIRPQSLKDAAAILTIETDARLLAGGMSLLPAMKLRLAAPSHLVDLGRIKQLSGITVDDAGVTIRAMTRHADVAASPEVRRAIPALSVLAGGIGDRQVRYRGTLGGSTANADPAACYPAAVLGLDAVVETDRRKLPASAFFMGIYETALESNEIIAAVRFRRPRRAGYVKFRHPASRFAVVGVFVAEMAAGDVRVAVTGAASSVFRSLELEAALAVEFSPTAARRIRLNPAGLNSDHFASAEYRAHLISEIAAQAVEQAIDFQTSKG
jgi:aerobic carbon-monoxide dehydrogenase medium subunit